MTLRRILFHITFFAVAPIFGATAEKPSFQIAITTAKAFVMDDAIPIYIKLTSTSHEDLLLNEVVNSEQEELNYAVKIDKIAGGKTLYTRYGEDVRNHRIVIVSTVVKMLKTGEFIEGTMRLDKLIKIDGTSEYRVSVSRYDPAQPAKVIHSNVLEIRVLSRNKSSESSRTVPARSSP